MNDDVEFKRRQWRSRLVLLLIVALFFGSFGIAAILRFSGWQPEHSRNFGTLINPPIDFSAQVFTRTDGTAYPWQPEENRWRILFVSGKPCAQACQRMLDTLVLSDRTSEHDTLVGVACRALQRGEGSSPR